MTEADFRHKYKDHDRDKLLDELVQSWKSYYSFMVRIADLIKELLRDNCSECDRIRKRYFCTQCSTRNGANDDGG